MWSQLDADLKFYGALRHPGGRGGLRRMAGYFPSRGLIVLEVHRLTHYCAVVRRSRRAPSMLALKLLVALGRALVLVLSKSDISPRSAIESGVYLSDRGYLMIGPQRVGRGTVIHHRVTIGSKAGGGTAKATVGENVWIGPDCVIYGNIAIGDGATVLPGSVLSFNVPPRAVVGGNPATILRREFDNSSLRRSLETNVDRSLFAN